MRDSFAIGFNFSFTSAIITTLGLIVGLSASTQSSFVVIGGILTIAIADSMSDALGMHIAQEASKNHKIAWESTLTTFLGKFFLSLFFILPILFLDLFYATIISIIIGLTIISFISYKMAIKRKQKTLPKILEHLSIAILVIILTHFFGTMIGILF